MKIKEIDIKSIKVKQNIRTRLADLGQMMESIKQHGLLHPIGVYKEGTNYALAYGARRLEACIKLGWNTITVVVLSGEMTKLKFLSINTVENIHRSSISPIELGKVCRMLKDEGLSNAEIMAKLSITKSRVEGALKIYRDLPKEYEDLVGFATSNMDKRKVPFNVVNTIFGLRIKKSQKIELLMAARKQELSVMKVMLVGRFIVQGSSVKKALEVLDDYTIKNIKCIVSKDELAKMKLPFARYAMDTIRKRNSKLLYPEED